MNIDTKKKRIAIFKKGGVTTRLDYTYLSDAEFDEALENFASKMNLQPESILSYTLGDEDAEIEGTVYFCPKCGSYNEDGFEPHTRQYYREDKETGEIKPAGYFKSLEIDCMHCEEIYELHTDKFQEESKRLTELFEDSKE